MRESIRNFGSSISICTAFEDYGLCSLVELQRSKVWVVDQASQARRQAVYQAGPVRGLRTMSHLSADQALCLVSPATPEVGESHPANRSARSLARATERLLARVRA